MHNRTCAPLSKRTWHRVHSCSYFACPAITSPGIRAFSMDGCPDAAAELNIANTSSSNLTTLIHVDSDDMNDSAEEQQIDKGDVNDVPQGKQTFPTGKLGCTDNRIEILSNLLFG